MSERQGQKWLEFKFFCNQYKSEEILETLYQLGKGPTLLDNSIASVVARWTEIINVHTGEITKVGTTITGFCIDTQQYIISAAIFKIGAVDIGSDYFLNKIHFWDSVSKEHSIDVVGQTRVEDWKGGEER